MRSGAELPHAGPVEPAISSGNRNRALLWVILCATGCTPTPSTAQSARDLATNAAQPPAPSTTFDERSVPNPGGVPTEEPPAMSDERVQTCSNQPSPALAAKRRPEASCCYVSSGTMRKLFRPMVEAFNACPHGTGRVVVKATIEEDGSIVQACVQHPARWSEAERSCVLKAVLDHHMPPEDYDFCPVRTIIYPFEFI